MSRDRPTGRPRWFEDAERLDLAIYAAVARTPTTALDVAMNRLSRTADYSRLSHYPGDVLAGALIGAALAQVATHMLQSAAATNARPSS